jgi:hypothetical protein
MQGLAALHGEVVLLLSLDVTDLHKLLLTLSMWWINSSLFPTKVGGGLWFGLEGP